MNFILILIFIIFFILNLILTKEIKKLKEEINNNNNNKIDDTREFDSDFTCFICKNKFNKLYYKNDYHTICSLKCYDKYKKAGFVND